MGTLYVINAPHFYSGLVVRDGVVVKAAPIINYMVGWDIDAVIRYALKKKWGIMREKDE